MHTYVKTKAKSLPANSHQARSCKGKAKTTPLSTFGKAKNPPCKLILKMQTHHDKDMEGKRKAKAKKQQRTRYVSTTYHAELLQRKNKPMQKLMASLSNLIQTLMQNWTSNPWEK